MFDLEKSIAGWRKQMLTAGIKSPVPLEELEIHLREEIERQIKLGLSGQKAFEISIQQIGKADVMKSEFEKVDGAKEWLEWRLKQIMFFAVLGMTSLVFAPILLFKLGTLSGISSAQQMSGLAALVVMITFAGIGQFGYKLFPVILNKRLRDVICTSVTVVMAIWLGIFFRVILQRVDFTLEQLFVAIFWGFFAPFGVMAGLTIGLEKAARKSIAT
jgi:hypothetical protein